MRFNFMQINFCSFAWLIKALDIQGIKGDLCHRIERNQKLYSAGVCLPTGAGKKEREKQVESRRKTKRRKRRKGGIIAHFLFGFNKVNCVIVVIECSVTK